MILRTMLLILPLCFVATAELTIIHGPNRGGGTKIPATEEEKIKNEISAELRKTDTIVYKTQNEVVTKYFSDLLGGVEIQESEGNHDCPARTVIQITDNYGVQCYCVFECGGIGKYKGKDYIFEQPQPLSVDNDKRNKICAMIFYIYKVSKPWKSVD